MNFLSRTTFVISLFVLVAAGCGTTEESSESSKGPEDILSRYSSMKDPAELERFKEGLTKDEAARLEGLIKTCPTIFEVSPPAAEAGDQLEIFGMNFDGDSKKIRVAFIGASGTKFGEIKRLDSYEIQVLVPYDCPGGPMEIDVQKITDSGEWVSSLNKPPFWSPARDDQVASDIGWTEIKPNGEAIGYFRNHGDRDKYSVSIEEGLLSVEAEAIKMEDHKIIVREDGYPDVFLEMLSSSGISFAENDDYSRKVLSAALHKMPLSKDSYTIYLKGDPSEKHEDGEQQRGWYRLRTRYYSAPYVTSISPALGPGDTVITITAYNLNQDKEKNKVELVKESNLFGIWKRSSAITAEIENIERGDGEYMPPLYTINVRVPEEIKKISEGYRIRLDNGSETSDIYPESTDFRYYLYPGGDEYYRTSYLVPIELKPEESGQTIVGYTSRVNIPVVIEAFKSQSIEMSVHAINSDLSTREDVPVVKLYSIKYNQLYVKPATDQLTGKGSRKLTFESMPYDDRYAVYVEPGDKGNRGLYWLTFKDTTRSPPDHEISIVSGHMMQVREGPAPSDPLVVKVTIGGRPLADATVIFEGPCRSTSVKTNSEGKAAWSGYTKPPRSMMATVEARLKGSPQSVSFNYFTMDIHHPHGWDWDNDGLSEPEEMFLGTDPRKADPDPGQYRKVLYDPENQEKVSKIEQDYKTLKRECGKRYFRSWRTPRPPATVKAKTR